ncbi:MAG: heavy metal-responsive transcriptional regulator [Candidatus Dormibacteraeota bacterium]|nr:heavy metal-responsive transcriptional regulator [Candidatus Dormibacteraeota bacterium]
MTAMRIGELASRTGLKTSALRFYEDAGLLPAPVRSPSGYRAYGPEAVGRVAFIKRARALGLSLDQIQDPLAHRATPAADRDRLRHTVAHRLAETDGQIAELTMLRQELEGLYVRMQRSPAPDCGHVGDCACWLPSEKEVMAMSAEVKAAQCCDGADCAECGCESGSGGVGCC